MRTDFCDHVHFFAYPEAVQPWVSEHPTATVLPVAEAATPAGQLVRQHLSTDDHDNCC